MLETNELRSRLATLREENVKERLQLMALREQTVGERLRLVALREQTVKLRSQINLSAQQSQSQLWRQNH